MRPQGDEGWHASLLAGIPAGFDIIRDSSVFTYNESAFRNILDKYRIGGKMDSRIGGKMKIRLEKPALNNFKADGWQK